MCPTLVSTSSENLFFFRIAAKMKMMPTVNSSATSTSAVLSSIVQGTCSAGADTTSIKRLITLVVTTVMSSVATIVVILVDNGICNS